MSKDQNDLPGIDLSKMSGAELLEELWTFLETPTPDAIAAGYFSTPALADDLMAEESVKSIWAAMLSAQQREWTARALL